MAVSRLLLFAETALHTTFFGSICWLKIGRNCESCSNLNETWSESYRVGRSRATGRHPGARFGPERSKKQKYKKQLRVGQSLYIFYILINIEIALYFLSIYQSQPRVIWRPFLGTHLWHRIHFEIEKCQILHRAEKIREPRCLIVYTHNLMLVKFVLVTLIGLLVITCSHARMKRRH